MVLEIQRLPILQDNYAYLLWEPAEGVSAVIDPGAAEPVIERLGELRRGLDWILSTHHHVDHTAGNLALKERFGSRVAGPAAEAAAIPGIDLELSHGDRFVLGASIADIIGTPGHTAGAISYYFADSRAIFTGDTLFALGCGRLFEEKAETMWQSLGRLMELPDETLVYCGHEYTLGNARFALSVDPDNAELQARAAEVEEQRARLEPTVPSLLGLERATNPFLRARNAADFARLRALKDRF